MATIPVEKKSGLPLWMWLIPLLLLLGLLAYFLTRDTDDGVATTDTTDQVDTAGPDALDPDGVDGPDGAATGAAGTAGADAPAADGGVDAGGGAITSLADLNSAIGGASGGAGAGGTGGSLDGRPVRLADTRVTSVVGDSAFYVGTGAERVLVILANVGEEEAGADGSDGVFNVDEGDLVGLTGELKATAPGMRGMSQLTSGDRTAVGQRGYVVVTRPNGLTQLTQ